jgi:hypothetical protein
LSPNDFTVSQRLLPATAFQAINIRAPVASNTAHKMRLSQGTGTRVLK